MLDPEQRRLLGEFVRAHRERLKPIGPSGRRRTPGLRREELAARAGISVTWCAWLEQGRDVQASAMTLGRLARALALSRAERAYLFELAGRRDPEADGEPAAADCPPSLAAIVHELSSPAYGLDRLWAPCCWNSAAERLFPGWLDQAMPPSLLQFVFRDVAAQALIPDWEHRARRLLAEYRADFSRTLSDPRSRRLVSELSDGSALFRSAWNEQLVLEREGGRRTFRHPIDGLLTFEQHTFAPAERPDYKLVVLSAVATQRAA